MYLLSSPSHLAHSFFSSVSIPLPVSLPPPFPSSVLGVKARILLSLEKTSATESVTSPTFSHPTIL